MEISFSEEAVITEETLPLLDDKVLENILELGSRMLTSGGEVHRVEDTIIRICSAYGASRTDVLTITNNIAVTVHFDNRPSITQTRRVRGQSTDLSMLSHINDLSRYICSHPCSAELFKERLDIVTSQPGNSFPVKIVIWAVVSADFTIFFGGSIIDALCSAVIGALLAVLKTYVDPFLQNNYFAIIICGIAGSIMSTAAMHIFPGVSSYYINIGNIMLFIPGIALTTAIRDIFSGDTISGIMKFIETILMSLMIAWSFALFSERTLPIITSVRPFIRLITSFIGTLTFACMFHTERKDMIPAAVGGLFSCVFVITVSELGFSAFLGYGIGASMLTLYAELTARRQKAPATVFLTVGVIPMLPGSALYRTMNYAMQQAWDLFFMQGLTTLLYAFSLAAGMILVTVLWSALQRRFLVRYIKLLARRKL